MPKGRSSQNKNVRQYLVWFKPSRLARSIPAALGLLVAVYGCVWLVDQASMIYEQQKIESHLENKYKEKFAVTGIKREASGFGVSGWISATAAPLNDKTLVFKVTDTEGKISDGYLGARWLPAFKQSLMKMVESAYSKPLPDVEKVSIGVNGSLQGSSDVTMTLQEALANNSAEVGLDIVLRSMRPSILTREAYVQEMSLLAQQIYAKGFRDATIDYSFRVGGDSGLIYRCIVGEMNFSASGDLVGINERCKEKV